MVRSYEERVKDLGTLLAKMSVIGQFLSNASSLQYVAGSNPPTLLVYSVVRESLSKQAALVHSSEINFLLLFQRI